MKAMVLASLICVGALMAIAQQPTELRGQVKYKNNTPAARVVISISGFNVVTDANGYYKIGFLRPGLQTVRITPPGKSSRFHRVKIQPTATEYNVKINW